MDGHERRARRKKEKIKKSAVKLFNKYGINKVSMDEIASNANVSKVTIYKYFNSKDELYTEVIKMVYTETFIAIEEIVNREISFIDKLKFIISSKIQSTKTNQGNFLQEIIENNYETNEYIHENFKSRTKELIFKFFDQGRQDGYIRDDISNELLIQYLEIFQTGLNDKSEEIIHLSKENNVLEKMIDLYFFGIINKEINEID